MTRATPLRKLTVLWIVVVIGIVAATGGGSTVAFFFDYEAADLGGAANAPPSVGNQEVNPDCVTAGNTGCDSTASLLAPFGVPLLAAPVRVRSSLPRRSRTPCRDADP